MQFETWNEDRVKQIVGGSRRQIKSVCYVCILSLDGYRFVV